MALKFYPRSYRVILTLLLLMSLAPWAKSQYMATIDSVKFLPSTYPTTNQFVEQVVYWSANFTPCDNMMMPSWSVAPFFNYLSVWNYIDPNNVGPGNSTGADTIPLGFFPQTGMYISICTLFVDSLPILSYSQSIDTFYISNGGFATGRVFDDVNNNCVYDNGEALVYNAGIGAIDQSQQQQASDFSDGNGVYFMPILNTGSYSLDYLGNLPVVAATGCPASGTIQNIGDTIQMDIPVNVNANCSFLEVDMIIGERRLCHTGYSHVNYWNYGFVAANNAQIDITYDPFYTPLSASIPYTQNGNVLTFNLGNVGPQSNGFFWIEFQNSCNINDMGSTRCIEAVISPADTCFPPNQNWSGARVQASGYCDGDTIRYKVKNIGTGPMTAPETLRVYEDWVLMMQQQFQLNPNDSVLIDIYANSSTYRLEADQVPFFPEQSIPRAFVERCGTSPFSLGYITGVQQDDLDNETEIECVEILSPYDPNEKHVSPAGVDAPHYIENTTQLDYTIHFQNTGTAPAENVVLHDTLDLNYLDISTLQPLTGSHPYTVLTQGNVLIFNFENINLPDSNADYAGSQGYVKFRIQQQPGNQPNDVINNSAGIYFDYNPAVITNTAFNTIHPDLQHYLSTVSIDNIIDPSTEISVFPNPFADVVNVNIKGMEGVAGTIEVTDLTGKVVIRSNQQNLSQFSLNLDNLAGGTYLYRIFTPVLSVASGKIVRM